MNFDKSHPMWVRGLKLEGRVDPCRFAESHPMWVRGLKLSCRVLTHHQAHVASYVGAWIETKRNTRNNCKTGVASYVGAWIETNNITLTITSISVASYVGAWIETTVCHAIRPMSVSHPMWVRGLKHRLRLGIWKLKGSRILCGCVD